MDSTRSPREVPAVGWVWYHEADYDRLRNMFVDGAQLQPTFLQWQDEAERASKQLARQGYLAIKVYIDPDTFPEWCRANGHDLDANARSAYAASETKRLLCGMNAKP